MTKNQAPPSKSTLGDYVMYQGPKHFSSIAIPNTAKALEIKPSFLTLIITHQLKAKDHEDLVHNCLHSMNWWE